MARTDRYRSRAGIGRNDWKLEWNGSLENLPLNTASLRASVTLQSKSPAASSYFIVPPVCASRILLADRVASQWATSLATPFEAADSGDASKMKNSLASIRARSVPQPSGSAPSPVLSRKIRRARVRYQ